MVACWRVIILCGILLPLHAQEQPPVFPKAFTGHAEFETTVGFKEKGWATLVTSHHGLAPYLLSVRQLLGPGGGFSHQVTAEEVTSFVRSIAVDSFSDGMNGYVVDGLPMASLTSSNLFQHPMDDLAVYRLHNVAPLDQAITLAPGPSVPGATLWLITKPEKTNEILLVATTVSGQRDRWLTVQSPAGTPVTDELGAPFLNAAGQLVGLYSHRDPVNPALLDLIPASTILQVIGALDSSKK